MTVAADIPVRTFLGNGTAAPLTIFRILAPDDVVVTRVAPGNVRTILTRGVDYSVAGEGGPSATVTPLAPIAVGTSWKIRRATARTQPADYVTGDAFAAATHELALDRQMMAVQEQDVALSAIAGRSLLLPDGEQAALLPSAALRGSRYLGFDADGDYALFLPPVVTAASGASVSSRLGLATIAAPVGLQTAFLSESGRGGLFVFMPGDLSAEVAADPAQGMYVAPIAAPSGAAGAWVRQSSGGADVRWFGAVPGASDSKAAFEATNAVASVVMVVAAAFALATTPALTKPLEIMPGATLTGPGATALGYAPTAVRQTLLPASVVDQFALQYYRRQANHIGGTPGYTSAGLRVDTHVGPWVTNYEWAIIGAVHNGATSAENVGIYAQGNMMSTGSTWGLVGEFCDMTYTSSAGKGEATGVEADMYCNGADTASNRAGIRVVVGDAKHGRTGVAGVKGVATYGILIQPQLSGNSGEFKNGVVVMTATDAAFQSSAIGTYGLRLIGTNDYGVDTTGAIINGAAIRINQDTSIAFNAAATRSMNHNGASWNFVNAGTIVARIADNGAYMNGANQIIGPRGAAIADPAGGGTVDVQARAAIVAILAAKRTHGLIAI